MDETPPVSPVPPERPSAPEPPLVAPPPLHHTSPALGAPQPIIVQSRARTGNGWKVFAVILLVLFLLSLVFNPLHFLAKIVSGGDGVMQGTRSVGPQLREEFLENHGSKNKIAIIPIDGVISGQAYNRSGYNMVDLVEDQFARAAHDQRVKAVILKVNSPGGEVLASDDIYRIVQKFQETTSKPVVADMGSLAASGGYYVSAPCQWIVANELTITGSIGVIMQGYNFRGLMDKVGVRPETFKSGRFKDMLSATKRPEEITAEEREMIQSMVNETFDRFKSVVREGRAAALKGNKNQGQTLAENWEQYADGRILSGKEAHRLGFVDELGNFDVAVTRARKLAGISDANLIQYQQPFGLFDVLGFLGESESKAIKIDVGIDAPRLKVGHLYFMCPTVLPR
jgi:protease IV